MTDIAPHGYCFVNDATGTKITMIMNHEDRARYIHELLDIIRANLFGTTDLDKLTNTAREKLLSLVKAIPDD